MPDIGGPELLVILVIVILLFGVGRLGQIGGELGKAIRELRKAVSGEDDSGTAPGPGQDDSHDK